MKILGIDLETTDLDIENCEITELGAVLWDTEAKMPLEIINHLCYTERKISDEAREINGIDDKILISHGKPIDEEVIHDFVDLAEKSQAIVAHNATLFDRPILERIYERVMEQPLGSYLWIDTRTDIPFPKKIRSRNLTTLAAEHGFLNPFPHRAVTDVLTMLKIMSHYPIGEIIERAKSPTIKIKAVVSYDDRQRAKDYGFYWDPDKKIWHKALKLCDYENEVKMYDFKIEEIV